MANNLNPSLSPNLSECFIILVMSQSSSNFQLQFYIKLTQIIGRTFTDLQQLLTNQLKRQQYQLANVEPILPPNNQPLPVTAIEPELPNHPIVESIKQIEQENKQQTIQKLQNKSEIRIKRKYVRTSKAEKLEKKKQKPLTKKKLIIKKTGMEKIKAQNKIKVKGKLKSKKKLQESGKPYPPLNAFMLFLKENKKDIMKQKPELSPSQISKYASTLWNDFGEAQKEIYIKLYRKNHEEYLQELKAFQQKEQCQKNKANDKLKLFKYRQPEQKQKSDSLFSLNDDKSKQNGGVRLRENLRSRSQRRRLGSGQIICVESEVEELQNNLDENEE